MTLTGGCYCGAIRYAATQEPRFRTQCHCRECQYFTGGNPNVLLGVPLDGFSYTQGEPKTFKHPDKPDAVTRHFCGVCGTHVAARRDDLAMMIVKVGGLDDPSVFGEAQLAIFTCDAQSFHHIPEGAARFERTPPRKPR